MGGLGTILEDAYPELKGKQDFYSLIGKELFAKGITNTESFGGMMSDQGLKAPRLSPLGKQFLAFIEAPA
jgi:hypothetical protein